VKSIEEWLNRPGGLSRQLRDLRRAAGMTGTRLAHELGWTQSKISKIETGRQMPTEDDVIAWARGCRARRDNTQALLGLLAEAQGLHREWRQQVRLGQVAIQRNYDELALRAKSIRNAEVVFIPGLLQTAAYAHCRIAEGVRLHGSSPEEIEAATARRMQRQQVLYDTSKTFEFIVTEAALRFLLCPVAAMLGQLDRLLTLAGLAHIKLGVIPFGVELPTAPQNAFILFDNELAVVETFAGETMHHAEEAEAYAAAMDSLAAEAWYEQQARELIIRASQALGATPKI
jgi:transcriptional regulator with XRE-family HTH domain